jgi:hypothetical protein
LKKIQILPLDQQDHAKEATLVQRHEQTLTKLNDSYLQRAKKNWAKDGDRNTAFFTVPLPKEEGKTLSSQ